MIDVLLQNAEIVDGTNTPRYRGDIAIEGEHIADIGSLDGAVAQTVIDMVIFLMSDDNVKMQLQHPAMMIGTDGFGLATEGPMASGMLHPRSFGTYPRLFGQYVREESILSLEEASWKASGFPAQKLRLTDRGAIKKGYQADLVVFDPNAIKDQATYTKPLQYPSGINYVLINGEIVIDQGKQTPARPGEVIRKKL
jgi:N-acyl-D-amino-acid deacylase